MKFSSTSKVALIPFALAAALVATPPAVKAGGESFSSDINSGSKEMIDSKSSDVGLGKFSSFPFHVTVSVRGGYDDNINFDTVNKQGSGFINGALGFSYDFGNARTKLNLNTGVSATYYFDSGSNNNSDDFSVNAYLGFSITHRATPRLTLAASISAAYLSRPGFDTFNSNFFVAERRSQNFFQTLDKFSVAYAWTPRFSTVSSYTLGYIDYNDAVISNFEDRFEHTIGNEFRYLILPTTSLVGEYRFGLVDYRADNNRDSYSHFFLAGVDHSFSPRFNISVRAGVEVRHFDDNPNLVFGNVDDTRVAPYAEGTINYALGQNTSISWTNRYSLIAPNLPDALTAESYRTGLSIRHNFTARISAGLNFAYQHDSYDSTAFAPAFTEDSFDIGLNARYAINRNFSVDVGYQHTEVDSDQGLFRSFDRNQYYAGVTFTW